MNLMLLGLPDSIPYSNLYVFYRKNNIYSFPLFYYYCIITLPNNFN